MGYRSIENLYKNQMIFLFKECFCLEKVHGTSAHISFKRERQMLFWNLDIGGQWTGTEEEFQAKWPDSIHVTFFSGGASHEQFVSLFDKKILEERFRALGMKSLIIYGEACGGKMQAMSHTYGKSLRFIAFEALCGEIWLDVPRAEHFCTELGLEFMPYCKIPTTLEAIDAERDRDSEVAIRWGLGEGHKREGVVLRPLIELVHQGERGGPLRSKHKRDEFKETKTQRIAVGDPTYFKVLEDAEMIAEEWTTEQRLLHVIDSLQAGINAQTNLINALNNTKGEPPIEAKEIGLKEIILAMFNDIVKESKGEIVIGKETRGAISKKTVAIYKEWMMKKNEQDMQYT